MDEIERKLFNCREDEKDKFIEIMTKKLRLNRNNNLTLLEKNLTNKDYQIIVKFIPYLEKHSNIKEIKK